MEQKEIISSFEDAIAFLQSNSSQLFEQEVVVPSLGTTIKLRELTAEQQRSLIDSALASVTENKDNTLQVLFSILQQNIVDSKDVLNNLNYFDRCYLTLILKKQTTEYLNVEYEDGISEKVTLQELLDNFNKFKIPSKETIFIDRNNIKIELEVSAPTIKSEIEFSNINQKASAPESETEMLRKLVGNTYILETCKFVNSIKIDDLSLKYENLTANQKVKIIEKLPAAVVQRVLEVVLAWKSSLNDVLTAKSSSGLVKTLDIMEVLFMN